MRAPDCKRCGSEGSTSAPTVVGASKCCDVGSTVLAGARVHILVCLVAATITGQSPWHVPDYDAHKRNWDTPLPSVSKSMQDLPTVLNEAVGSWNCLGVKRGSRFHKRKIGAVEGCQIDGLWVL
eukprot:1478548-Amphidinium_carterae.1